MSHGPLAEPAPAATNYRLDGPEPHLFLDPFPRRLRAEFAGTTVFDTLHGQLLHRTGELPQLYVPQDEVLFVFDADAGADAGSEDSSVFGPTSYWSLRSGERVADRALWSHPDPPRRAGFLRGLYGVSFAAMDAWFDEAEQVYGHLRDPYHRVDVRSTQRRVRVSLGNQVLAETDHPLLVSETGLPNRLYLPPEDVLTDRLSPSSTRTVCPYKGEADYAGAGEAGDVAWRYRDPLPEASPVAGYWCFDDSRVLVRADTRTAPAEPPADPEPGALLGPKPHRRHHGLFHRHD